MKKLETPEKLDYYLNYSEVEKPFRHSTNGSPMSIDIEKILQSPGTYEKISDAGCELSHDKTHQSSLNSPRYSSNIDGGLSPNWDSSSDINYNLSDCGSSSAKITSYSSSPMYDPTTQLNTRYISAYGNIVMLENKESLQIAHQLKAAVQKPNHKPLTVTKWSN